MTSESSDSCMQTAMRSVINNRPLSYRYLFFSFMGLLNDINFPQLTDS